MAQHRARRPRHLGYHLLVGGLLAGAVFVPSSAYATGDEYNCSDFTYQEDAQAVLEDDLTDPNGLDDDVDNIACEDLPSNAEPEPESEPEPAPEDDMNVPAPQDEEEDQTVPETDEGVDTGAEDEPVHAGTIRDWVGPEHCATANDEPALTMAEWTEFCAPSLDADESHTDGGDGWPEGAEVECQGYGCSPEQDAALNAAEAEANADERIVDESSADEVETDTDDDTTVPSTDNGVDTGSL